MTVQICFQPSNNDIAPLLCQYDNQCRPQPAYVEMTHDGCVDARYNSEIGSVVPVSVWYGVDLRWSISPEVSGEALHECLNDPDTLALLERVHQGHTLDYDWVGTLKGSLCDDASDAFERLQEIFDGVERVSVWNTEDWLFNGCDVFDHWPEGKRLEDCADELEDLVRRDGVVLTGLGVLEAIEGEAQDCVQQCRGPLLPDGHLRELLDRGTVTQEEVDDYLDSFEQQCGSRSK